MSKKPTTQSHRPFSDQRGHQPKPNLIEGHAPRTKGHQPTSPGTPSKPPSNPPNQGSAGKK